MSLTNGRLPAMLCGEVWQGCPSQLVPDQVCCPGIQAESLAAPATCAIPCMPPQVAAVPKPRSAALKALQGVGLVLIVLVLMASVGASYLISIAFCDSLDESIFLMTFGIVPFALTYLLSVLTLKWALLGRTRAGLYDATPWNMARLWLVDTLMQSMAMTMSLALILDPAIGVPNYLRLLGAKIGCEAPAHGQAAAL